jgi:hypothetical protein
MHALVVDIRPTSIAGRWIWKEQPPSSAVVFMINAYSKELLEICISFIFPLSLPQILNIKLLWLDFKYARFLVHIIFVVSNFLV